MKTLFTFLLIISIQCNLFSQANITCVNSGNWSDASNWSGLAIPSATDNVVIAGGYTITVDAPASCRNITVCSTATLKSDSAKVLNVGGNWINNGNFNSCKGEISFNGTLAQTIGGSISSSFYKLTINNTAGVSLNANQSLKYLLTISQGTFTTTGFVFTLLSNSLTTASIGPLSPGTDITGNIRMQRYMSSSETGWRFLGSPVKTTLADWSDNFTTSGFPGATYPYFYWCSIYSYDETVAGTSDYGYVIPSNVNDSIVKGAGYWCWVGPTPTTVEVTGLPAKFDYTYNISLTPDAGKGEDGWNMISNIYPSAIDWDSPSWTKSGVEDAVYIWDPSLQQYSTYAGGIGVNGGSNIIPSSQAFWIEANQTSPILSCNEEVKTTQDKVYLRANNFLSQKMPVKLTLEGNNFKDETVVCFADGSSQNVVANEDARKLFTDNALVPTISSMSGTTQLVINSVPANLQSISVPVKVKVGVSGVYTISRNQDLNIPENVCVYLEDKVTNTFTDLRTTPVYAFSISDTTSKARFLLHMSKPLEKTSVDTKCSYSDNGVAIVNYTSAGTWNTTWKDADDNIIAVHMNANAADTLKNIGSGLYKVTIGDAYGKCFSLTDTIRVNKAVMMKVNAVVNNNQCKNDNKGIITAQASGGSAPFAYAWSNSQNSSQAQNLASGVYTLVTTDANGCNDTTSYTVKTISVLQVDFNIENDVTNLYMNEPISFNNLSQGQFFGQWNFGNGTTYVTDPTNIYTNAGTYTVTLTSNDGSCFESVQKIINVKMKPGMGIANSENIDIYNSNDDAVVKFDLEGPAESMITVYSIDGKLINSQKVLAHKNTTNLLLGESHGIYLVRVETNGTMTTSKVIR